MTEIKQLLTLKEVCTILQCHPNTLRLWDKKGILKAVRIGERRTRRYKREDIQKLISAPTDEKSAINQSVTPKTGAEPEDELLYSEMRFRTLVEQSPFSKQIFNSRGESLIVNKSWEKLWGIKLEDLRNYNIFEDKQF